MENVKLKKALSREYSYGFHDEVQSVYETEKGLDESVVRRISKIKNEPAWMLEKRLQALREFERRPMPSWGADLSHIDFQDIIYYSRPTDKAVRSWDDVPDKMKKTFERLGIPEAERKFLAGAGAQYDSEVIYHRLREDLEKQGVIFSDMDSGLREHEEIVRKYFGTIIPFTDNKFAALNTAVWSGGSFLHVPKGVHVEVPLQAYFRINTKNMGQFERTLIIAEPGSSVHYLEGCFTKGTPILTTDGNRPIETIRPGQQVLTHNGRYRIVKHTQIRLYTGNLFQIKCEGKTHAIESTEEHPFLCVKKKGFGIQTPTWINASDLEEGDFLTQPIQNQAEGKNEGYWRQVKIQRKENFLFARIEEIRKIPATNVSVYNFSVEEDESYVAGGVAVHNCSAPVYTTDALHSAVVEIIAMEGSRVQYTTIQNWSNDVYNLVTKRAKAFKDSTVFWLDGNLGSRVTMKYPSVMLMEPGARGEVVSIAFAGFGQHQDAGAKIFHLAPNTSSLITSKSISKDGGRTAYRGLLHVSKNAHGVKSNVECDALILDEESGSDTVPYMQIFNDDVSITHEASVSKLDEQKLFYLKTRGFTQEKAKELLVQGFVEPFVKHLPMEYAVELNRLIELEMEGSVG